MRGAAIWWLVTSNAYVLDLELDGTYAPLRFAINDDLNQIARAWRQKHPAMTGGDCAEGDGRCVEDVLVRAMEARFDARHVISNAAIHCKLPGHAFPSEKLTDAVGTPKVESARQRLAGINPHVKLQAHAVRLSAANALAVLAPSWFTRDHI